MEPNLNGNIISFIPTHIFEEILVRLDIQTLVKCTCVCKDWNALIISFKFVSYCSGQTSDSKNQLLFFKTRPINVSPWWRATYSLHWDNDRFNLFRGIKSPPINDFKGTEVVEVSNGLVCLASDELPFKFILWNPTIEKYACLPSPIDLDGSLRLGFGFDQVSNNFKVVNIVYRHTNEFKDPLELDSVWVFSYATWSWKRLTFTIPSSLFIPHCFRQVLVNGVLHWIAFHKVGDWSVDFILTFDLANEVFGQILFPSGARSYGRNTIVTTGNSLLFIQETLDDEMQEYEYDDDEAVPYTLSIWIMKQYGHHESWTNIFSKTTEVDSNQILGVRKNGDLILDMGVEQICRYNPITPTYEPMEALKGTTFFRYHSESLYLLEKGEDVNSY